MGETGLVEHLSDQGSLPEITSQSAFFLLFDMTILHNLLFISERQCNIIRRRLFVLRLKVKKEQEALAPDMYFQWQRTLNHKA
jgi:hypothetical protein